jgi:hypothetical protein
MEGLGVELRGEALDVGNGHFVGAAAGEDVADVEIVEIEGLLLHDASLGDAGSNAVRKL